MKKYNILAISVMSLILVLGLIGAVVDKDDTNDRIGEYEHMYTDRSYGDMGMFSQGNTQNSNLNGNMGMFNQENSSYNHMGGDTQNGNSYGNMVMFNQGNSSYNHMGGDTQNGNSYGNMGNFDQGSSYGNMMGGMGRGGSFSNNSNSGEKIDIEVLVENVERYISQYNNNLEISDVFIYENSDYYFSIIEEVTGRGAMELLVNPYSGEIYPEFGPNMMWNSKYNMHNQNNYSMMGGMMGRNRRDNDYSYNDVDGNNELTMAEAFSFGNDYVLNKISKTATLSEDAHEFYGYYTFHIEDGNQTIAMLSVNGYTGDVWNHDWHGELTELIEGHND